MVIYGSPYKMLLLHSLQLMKMFHNKLKSVAVLLEIIINAFVVRILNDTIHGKQHGKNLPLNSQMHQLTTGLYVSTLYCSNVYKNNLSKCSLHVFNTKIEY